MSSQSASPSLPQVVVDHLAMAKDACIAAVTNYNRPGMAFRTRTYTVLMIIAWTALFHAIFHRRGKKPWYLAQGTGPNATYQKIDGEPKHWELSEAMRRYYRHEDTPERKNLEFMVALRNRIEHRDHPELDPALYGECQAMLMNFEELLRKEFGDDHAIPDQLALALQFTSLRPEAQKVALRRLQSSAATDLLEFIRQFRAGLPQEVLESSSYSLRVFLVPKLANREKTADLAVEFVPFDPTHPQEMEGLNRVAALIKEKQIPVASSGLMKPSEVVQQLEECLPHQVTMHTHTQAWKIYGARPATDAPDPRKTKAMFCLYDELSRSYGYTKAWVNYLCRKLSDPKEFERVNGAPPVNTSAQ